MSPQKPRTYEGRVLARQDDDVEDQGLGFDVTTLIGRQRSRSLLGRRQVLALGGAGAATVGLAACGADDTVTATSSTSSSATSATSSADLTEIPDETNGPYPGDGTNGPDALEESGIIRQDITASFGTSTTVAEGVPMTLKLNIYDLADGGAAYEGAAVYVWHCDRAGLYSMYSDGITEENYLRGVQVADADGLVQFTSIFPACYSGRWPHIHFEVYPDADSISDAANNISTSQVALPSDVCDTVYATTGYEQSVTNKSKLTLETDNIFGDDGGASQLATVTGDVTSSYVVQLNVGVDATTEAVQGMGGGDVPAGGGQGGGGQPPADGEMPTGTPPEGMTPPDGGGAPSASTTS